MKNFFAILLVLAINNAFAQKPPEFKFTKITASDLEKKIYAIDSGAGAVVLGDLGISKIVGNRSGWFGFEFKHRKRVHILNKSGYHEGDVEIYLYVSGSTEEKLTSVKAVTYNSQEGKVVETKMEKSAVFTDKLDKNHILKKFTLPNIKEGSIIDFEYTTASDFLFNLEPWTFQGSSPRLWSEYQLSIPEFFGYLFLTQGYHPYFINQKEERNANFTVSDARNAGATEYTQITSKVIDYRWAMKDVPELKEESFTSTLRNHVSKIEFQLSEYRYPLTYRQVMSSWPQVTKEMLEDEDFGKQLSTNNGWMEDDLKPLLVNATTQLEKAKKIYAYVRDNFVCTDHNALYTSQTLKNVLKTKKGNVADLNLLLAAILKHEGIKADPMILSTREHGYTYELYPVMNRFNYVACQAIIDNKTYNLDASRAKLGFGMMPFECYNGWARIINEASSALDLSPDSLREKKLTAYILIDDKGKWAGSMNQQLGAYESYNLRNKIKEEGEENYFKKVQKSYGLEVKTESAKIDSLEIYDAPLSIQHKFTMDPGDEDILYLNPLFGEAQKENPFKSAERRYPVEMPYTFDETIIATIYVPTGFEVEEIPKQIRVKLNEQNEGFFEYAIAQSANIISLRSRVKLDRTFYSPQEYEMLREFFNLIVKKQSEQIVFKKKK
jgi:hypothetical protein